MSGPSVARTTFSVALQVVLCAPVVIAQAKSEYEVQGMVADPSGKPVPFAYVYASNGASAVSSQDGIFRIKSPQKISLGSVVAARRLGFSPSSAVLEADSARGNFRITLVPLETQLAPVRVTARDGYDEFLDRSGFYRRMAKAGSGYFIEDAEIQKRNPRTVTAMLQAVPGVRILAKQGYLNHAMRANVPLGRGGLCALGLVVDGRRVRYAKPNNAELQPKPSSMTGNIPNGLANDGENIGGTFDEMIEINQVKAIEVYATASAVPNELQGQVVDGCGLVVVWTKYQ